MNENVDLVKDRKLHLDIRDIKGDRYDELENNIKYRFETIERTRELITTHLQSNETSPIAVIIGADDE